MIPRDFVQTLLSRVDIVDVIQGYLPLKKGGANYMARCPFHDEKSASFSVSPTKQFYYCFGCGAHGSAVGFLMEYAGLAFPEAVQALADLAGLQVPQDRQGDRDARQRTDAPPGEALSDFLRQAMEFYKARLREHPPAIDYLRQRGLTGQIAARFGLGYAPAGWRALESAFARYEHPGLVESGLVIEGEQGKRYDRFRDRVMFPILDARGGVIGFGGRVIGQGEPKYLNSPETPLFEKGRELYGLFQAKPAIRAGGTVVVVEGYMDVVALAQHGIAYAVATLGTATTPHHLDRLLRLAERVVFAFDGDKAGRRAARRALEVSLPHLKDGKDVAFLFLPAEHDPDSYIRAHGAPAFEGLLKAASPLSRFLVDELQREHPQDSAEGRAGLLHQAVEWLAEVRAPALALLLCQAVAEAARVPRSDLDRLLAAARPAPLARAAERGARHEGQGAAQRGLPPAAAPAGRDRAGGFYAETGGHAPAGDWTRHETGEGAGDWAAPGAVDGLRAQVDASYLAAGQALPPAARGQGRDKARRGPRREAAPTGFQGRRESPSSLEDRLLACLIQVPALVHSADPDPADADLGAPALAALAEFVRSCSEAPNLAAFIEAFRDGPHARALDRAMRRELPALQASDAEEIAAVLKEGLARLMHQGAQRRADTERAALIRAIEAGTASAAERARLRELLTRPSPPGEALPRPSSPGESVSHPVGSAESGARSPGSGELPTRPPGHS